MSVQIQLRRGTAAEWTSANPTLAEGELGLELDTLKIKMGDGSNAWADLDYIPSGSGEGGGSGTVESVSVVTANGLAGTVANPTSTPAITITCSITGLLKGNGTAISAATANTDYTNPAGLAAYAQPLDADLTAIAALTTTSFGLSFLELADDAAAITLLGLGTAALSDDGDFAAAVHTHAWADITGEPTTLAGYGITDAQGLDAELTAIAGLTSAADRLPYFTGSGTASLATFTTAGRALVDDADAAAQRVTIGLATIGTSFYQLTAADGTITLSAKAAFAFSIAEIRGLKTASGTCTVAIQINGVNVTGLSGLSVTSTPQDASASAANSVAAGDRVTLVISSSSSPTGLEFTISGTR